MAPNHSISFIPQHKTCYSYTGQASSLTHFVDGTIRMQNIDNFGTSGQAVTLLIRKTFATDLHENVLL